MGSAVIVGASGGIGRELTEALIRAGTHHPVHALSRADPDLGPALRRHAVDLLDESTVAAAGAAIAADGPVDLVLVASGLLHDEGAAPEKTFRALDPAVLARLFAVNAIGPALVAKHLLPLLPRQGRAVFAALSARVGSIADNRLGGWYGYRASKAALNQIIRTLAVEVGRTRPDTVVIGLHPGTVATPLSRPFRAGPGPDVFTPEVAAAHLLRVVATVPPSRSGRLFAWDGSEIPG